MFDLDLLRTLATTDAPSGFESAMRDAITARLNKLGIRSSVSPDGSVAAVIPAKCASKGKLMLQAHTDEVGFMVRSHTADGFLKISPLGLRDTRLLTGRRVTVAGKDEDLNGFIGAIPIHLSKDGKKVPSYSDLYVDIGADTKAEAETAAPLGCAGCFKSNFEVIGTDGAFIKSKALSGRAACAVLLTLAEHFSSEENSLPYDLYFAFSPRGKLSLSGGAALYTRLRPDCVISVTSFEIPNDESISSHRGVAVPLFEEKYTFDLAVAGQLKDALGTSDKIEVTAPTPSADECEFDLIRLKSAGAKLCAVKLPVKNRNTACEVMSRDSVDTACDLLKNALPQLSFM